MWVSVDVLEETWALNDVLRVRHFMWRKGQFHFFFALLVADNSMNPNLYPLPSSIRDPNTRDDTTTLDKVTTETSDFFLSASAVFALVLIVSGNYLSDLLNMNLRHILRHPFAKHMFALLTLYFFIVLLDASRTDQPVWKQVLRVVLLYTIFIIFVKTEGRFAIVSIVLLAVVYFVSNWKAYRIQNDKPITPETRLRFHVLQIVLGVVLFLSLFCGFFIYVGYQSHKFKLKHGSTKAWCLLSFLYKYDTGKLCVDHIPVNKLWHYGKQGMARCVGL